MLKIFGLAFLFAASSFILKALGWKGAPLVAACAIVGLLSLFMERLEPILEIFRIIKEEAGMGDAVECVLKIIGIGYLSGICSDICRELGEPSVASAVSLVARIESLAVISPIIVEILTLGLELVQ